MTSPSQNAIALGAPLSFSGTQDADAVCSFVRANAANALCLLALDFLASCFSVDDLADADVLDMGVPPSLRSR